MKMKIIICDSREDKVNEIRERVLRQYPDYTVMVFKSSFEMYEYIKLYGNCIDIIITDVRIDGANNILVLRDIKRKYPRIRCVFVSADYKSILDTFVCKASGFIPYPINDLRFSSMLKMCVADAESMMHDTVTLQTADSIVRCFMYDIMYVESNLRKITVHCANESYTLYGKLADMLSQFDKRFFRCHKSYIINLEYVQAYSHFEEASGYSSIKLINGETIPVSVRKQGETKRRLMEFARRNLEI